MRVTASLDAMEYWAMQYANVVEVISPSELRERVRNNLTAAAVKYQK